MVSTTRPAIVVKSIRGFVTKVTKEVVTNVVNNLQRPHEQGGTPVLTGWASSNWIPNVGSPRTGPAGTREAAEQGILPTDAQSELTEIRNNYVLSMGEIYITNAVHYIGSLNDGSSDKAPSGFVQANIIKSITTDLKGIKGR